MPAQALYPSHTSPGEASQCAATLTAPLLDASRPPAILCTAVAMSVCVLLRELAETRRCTILCTIHQPSAKIFSLFHKLFLLQASASRPAQALLPRPGTQAAWLATSLAAGWLHLIHTSPLCLACDVCRAARSCFRVTPRLR